MKKVLIAEDDAEIRGLVAFRLGAANYDVRAVADGEAALAEAKEFLPDVVILDWMMPRMHGLDAAIALRAEPDLQHVAIIMLTAKRQETDVQRGFAIGVDDYIVKPFSPRELVSRVDAAVARSRVNR